MIDYGLLASMLMAFGLPALSARRWVLESFDPPVGFVDAVLGAAAAGLVVGRLSTLVLDDPRALGRVSDMLVIRSGVEFWPGVAAAAGLTAWSARRSGVSPVVRLAALAPLAMVGYGSYEASCVFRGGCYGPSSPIGLRPEGLSTTMLPVGILMAGAVLVGAGLIRWWSGRSAPPLAAVVAAILVVAAVRGIGSFWLPKVGDGLTRQHRTSLAIGVAAVVLWGWGMARARQSLRATAR